MTDPQISSELSAQDDGWTHVRETVRMLILTIAQIEIALRESDDSIGHLTDAFTSMVDRENHIAESIKRLESGGSDEHVCRSIKEDAIEVTEKMQSAIVAFQFYDKLTQRLAHVGTSMEALSDLLIDEQRIYEADEWQTLQQNIKSKYSMREEHELFNAVMTGGDIKEAIRHYNEIHKEDSHDDIELF